MARLGEQVEKLRSKNAGPFWLTVDLFCGTDAAYEKIVAALETRQVAAAFGVAPETIKRFDIPDLNVIKFSLPRPTIQGAINDRDMHGASWAALLADIEIRNE